MRRRIFLNAWLALLSKGQLHFEHVAVESPDLTTVHTGDAARGEQAQARPGLAGLGGAATAIETLEQVQRLVGVGAGPAAADRQVDPIVFTASGDAPWCGPVSVQQRIRE